MCLVIQLDWNLVPYMPKASIDYYRNISLFGKAKILHTLLGELSVIHFDIFLTSAPRYHVKSISMVLTGQIIAIHFLILRFQRLVSDSNSITRPVMCRGLYRPKLMVFLCFLTSFNENTEIKP